MFDALSIEIIRGFGFGLQYLDVDDEDGKLFCLIVELGLLRVLLFWDKTEDE
jgi:hypothetical protein